MIQSQMPSQGLRLSQGLHRSGPAHVCTLFSTQGVSNPVADSERVCPTRLLTVNVCVQPDC